MLSIRQMGSKVGTRREVLTMTFKFSGEYSFLTFQQQCSPGEYSLEGDCCRNVENIYLFSIFQQSSSSREYFPEGDSCRNVEDEVLTNSSCFTVILLPTLALVSSQLYVNHFVRLPFYTRVGRPHLTLGQDKLH